MKVTFNDEAKLSIIKGEERAISCYIYDEKTFKPIDLGTNIPSILIKKTDNTCEELIGSVTDASMGMFDVSFTAVQSASFIEGTNQNMELKISDGATGVDLTSLNRSLDVFAALC